MAIMSDEKEHNRHEQAAMEAALYKKQQKELAIIANAKHPGPYTGLWDDYEALAKYWCLRSRYFEAQLAKYEKNLITPSTPSDDFEGCTE